MTGTRIPSHGTLSQEVIGHRAWHERGTHGQPHAGSRPCGVFQTSCDQALKIPAAPQVQDLYPLGERNKHAIA
jgi:hypothetical protein